MKRIAPVFVLVAAMAVATLGCGDDDSGSKCGNGDIDTSAGEVCDGDSLGGRQCTDFEG